MVKKNDGLDLSLESTVDKKNAVADAAPAVELSDTEMALMQAMELIKVLQAKVEKIETAGEKEVIQARPKLNVLEPFATIRTEGAVTYEQHGRKYDGGKRLIEE